MDPLSKMVDGKLVEMTEAEAAAFRATLPVAIVPVPTWTPLEFIERFTEAEQIAIVTAAQSNPALRLWYDKAMAAREIVADDARLIAGMDLLVSVGLLTAARRAAILGAA